jgi:hypothetical protein
VAEDIKQDPEKKPDDKPADPNAQKLAELQKANEELVKKIKAADDAEAKKKADEKKKAEESKNAKAIEEGKAKELAAELDAKLKAANAENERLNKMFIERAEAVVKTLPEAEQKRLEGYRSKVSIDVWLQMIDDAKGAPPPIVKPGAPPAAGGNPGVTLPDGFTPKPATLEVLEEIGRTDAAAQFKRIGMHRAVTGSEGSGDAPAGARVFSKSVKAMFADMNRVPVRAIEPAKK